MPALTVTGTWQSRLLAANELWQCWSGVLQIDTEAVEGSRLGIQLFGGDSQNCAVALPAGVTVYWRTAHGACVAGYVPQP